MLLTSVCLVSLIASSLAVPVQRSDTGDKLLAALGNGVATGLGGALTSGATAAVDAAVHEATSLLSSGLTKLVGGLFGKRNAVDNLESLGEEIFNLLKPVVEKEVEHVLGNLKLKRSKVGDELLAALTPQLTQAAGTIAGAALQPLTTELSTALASLTGTAVKGITSGLSSLVGGLFGKRNIGGNFEGLGEEIFQLLKPVVEKEVAHLLGNLKLKRSKVGDELLAALTPQLTQAAGTIAGAALQPLTSQLSTALASLTGTAVKGITSGLSSLVGGLFGKRNLGDNLEGLGGEIFNLLKPVVEKEVEQLLGNLKLKRSKVGDELLAALTPQLTQAAGTIAGAALQPLTTELSGALSSLTSTALKGITSGLSSLFGK